MTVNTFGAATAGIHHVSAFDRYPTYQIVSGEVQEQTWRRQYWFKSVQTV
jgi:hypothetical protein